MTTTEEVLSNLNKKTKDRVRLASEMSIEKLELPSPALTRALNGGLGYGRQSLIWGTKSAGKAQPTNLVIPTPSGDKKFGDIKVGDYVWGGGVGCAWVWDWVWGYFFGLDLVLVCCLRERREI